jgi:hypothetical protein
MMCQIHPAQFGEIRVGHGFGHEESPAGEYRSAASLRPSTYSRDDEWSSICDSR